MHIVIDPGHGDRANKHVVDSGVVSPLGQKESTAALATSFTLKFLFEQAGHSCTLTRVAEGVIKDSDRLLPRPSADAYISVHYNMPRSYGMLYYSDSTASKKKRNLPLAEYICKALGHKRCRYLWGSSERKWPNGKTGLYIDQIHGIPALLWEVEAIERYKDTRDWRLAHCEPFVKAFLAGWKALKYPEKPYAKKTV